MPYLKTSEPGTGNGAWSASTAYTVGVGVTLTDYDQVTGAGLRFVAIAANTGQKPTLSPTDPYWRLAHPVDSLQLLNAIGALATSAAFNGAGNEWTRAYRFNGLGGSLAAANQRFCLTFRNTGLGGQDDVILILNWRQSTASVATRQIRVGAATGWLGNTGSQNDQLFRGAWASGTAYTPGNVVSQSSQWWVCVTAHTASTAPAATNPQWVQVASNADADAYRHNNSQAGPYHTHWNGGPGGIPLWFWANQQRLMWVSQSDNRYALAYAGLLHRFGPRAQSPFPLILSGNTTSTSVAYDDSGLTNIPFTRDSSTVQLRADGDWQSLSASYAAIIPYSYGTGLLGQAPSGDYGLEEVAWYMQTGGLQGRMDGAFAVSANGLVSGSELSNPAGDFVVFENVYRQQSGGYVALKKS